MDNIVRVCELVGCSVDITHKQKSAKFCCNKHRTAWHRKYNQPYIDKFSGQYMVNYYKAHKQGISLYDAARYDRLSDQIKENVKEWANNNPDKVTKYKRDYRARKANSRDKVDYTEYDFLELVKFYGNKCQYCHIQFSDEVRPARDHVIPLARGGRDALANILPSCNSCNSSKQDRHLFEFLRLTSKSLPCCRQCPGIKTQK